MKICELRFKNLNCLYGEWVIDFTDPDYQTNGIFALTGPTGAGKSTILDAICLALYGATPRLGKITKNNNDILSSQASNCYAEVYFISQKGKFRCKWAQRRAHNQLNGKLQDQDHQISDADTGKILESKKSRVIGIIEKKTGMDFERFTRSILLAQGRFDYFLKADVEQKSKLLEQITGTEIYSQISQQGYERCTLEKNKLDQLKDAANDHTLLSEEIYQLIKTDQQKCLRQQQALLDKIQDLETSIKWHHNIIQLQTSVQQLRQDQIEFEKAFKQFAPERQRLSDALKAQELEGPYQRLTTLKKAQTTDQTDLQSIKEKLPDLTSKKEELKKSVTQAEQEKKQAIRTLEQISPLLKQTRDLDQTRRFMAQKQQEHQQVINQKKLDCQIIQSHSEELSKQHTEASKQMAQLREYEINHTSDNWLVTGLTGLEADLICVQTKQVDIEKSYLNLQELETGYHKTYKDYQHSNQQVIDLSNKLSQIQFKVTENQLKLEKLLKGHLLREYRADKEAMIREKILMDKIASLEKHRQQLNNGTPCPLCGATTHPYARNILPSPDEQQEKIDQISHTIEQIDQQQNYLLTLKQQEQTIDQHYQQAMYNSKLIKKDLNNIHHEKTKLDTQHSCKQDELINLISSLKVKLAPFGLSDFTIDQIPNLRQRLKHQQQNWLNTQQKKVELSQHVSHLTTQLQNQQQHLEKERHILQQAQEEQTKIDQNCQTLQQERDTLFGKKSPDQEEQKLKQKISETQAQEKQMILVFQHAMQKQAEALEQQRLLTERLYDRNQLLKTEQQNFTIALKEYDFTDQAAFLAARLPVNDRKVLQNQASQLDQRQTEIKILVQDRQKDLTTEINRRLSNQSLADLQQAHQTLTEQSTDLREKQTTYEIKLKAHAQALQDQEQQQIKIKAQEKEWLLWNKLSALIGSADGKKFRSFAQGLSFDIMICRANKELAKISDRYLLLRDLENVLDLNVIDHYQAGNIRSTRNLSGGESFLVSLALALSLSGMVSCNVRVDSLFLDEGLATLDEDSLDTALDLLASLYQEGKLIGIISHLPALKERISTQISITSTPDGHSHLSGPGCTRR